MSAKSIPIFWLVIALTSVLVIALPWWQMSVARREATTLASRHTEHHRLGNEADALRARIPAWATNSSPTRSNNPNANHGDTELSVSNGGGAEKNSAISSRVAAALSSTGLAASLVTSLQREPDVAAAQQADLRASRARVMFTLEGLSLPQLGDFLASWKRHEPEWSVISADITPQPPPSSSARSSSAASSAPSTTSMWAKGGDAPLRVNLTIESLSLTVTPPSKPGASKP